MNKLLQIDKNTPMVILTGAGVSAASGIPTFRGEGGLWNGKQASDIASVEQISTPEGMEEFWKFHNEYAKIMVSAKPNKIHHYLASLPNATIITQNIDCLHQKAETRNLIDLHGSIVRLKCIACESIELDTIQIHEKQPLCELCGRPMRPDVVLFGEDYDLDKTHQIAIAMNNAALYIGIGTSGTVAIAQDLLIAAKEQGMYTIEFNTEVTRLTDLYDTSYHFPHSNEVLLNTFI